MSKDPTGLDELLRIIDWDLKQQKIEGQFTHNERVSLLHKDISAYTTNKIIEQVEAIYDEYALGGKDEFEFGKWLKAKLAELKGKL